MAFDQKILQNFELCLAKRHDSVFMIIGNSVDDGSTHDAGDWQDPPIWATSHH